MKSNLNVIVSLTMVSAMFLSLPSCKDDDKKSDIWDIPTPEPEQPEPNTPEPEPETITVVPVQATSTAAKSLLNYLAENFEKKTISGMMANVAWNNEESERINVLTGKYPAINGYDYIHLPYSVNGENWIDYSDITPVKSWASNNGIVAFSWHWLVPKVEVDVYGPGSLVVADPSAKPDNSVATLWEGEKSMGAWADNVQLDASLFDNENIVNGAKLHVATKDLAQSPQGSFKTMAENWPAVADGYEYFGIKGSFVLELTDDIVSSIKANGLVISGQNYSAVGVYVIPAPEGGVDTELAGKDNKSESFPTVMPTDWSGWFKVEASAFAEATVGDIITAKVSDLSAGAQGSFKDSGWKGLITNDAVSLDYFEISGEFKHVIDESTLVSLQKGGLIVSGHDYTLTGIVLTHYANGATVKPQEGIPSLKQIGYDDYTYQPGSKFHVADAITEGTWENDYLKYDLANVTKYLKLLQSENIPVLWRPFHEASGKWFWWGNDAASYKKLWIMMFDYFKAQGIDNLIWVWTSQIGDNDWYPGDEYVDVIGCDIYGSTPKPQDAYKKLKEAYPNKIITLSECGWSDYTNACVPTISKQIEAGATWSWFMPWYDNQGAKNSHADDAWWIDAMSNESVITRDLVPAFK
ncbi:MAG: glycoside hydrolase family 26 protein [Bacteroidales bacterium]|nr:glycoside hydrolase family 26 protein [Bacteroidales bacterium]